MGRLSHPNLVRLLGYCVEDRELLLVYEYMPRGSLENHLFRSESSLPLECLSSLSTSAQVHTDWFDKD